MYFIVNNRTKVKNIFFPCNIFLNLHPLNYINKVSNIADTPLLAGAISKAEEIILVGHVNPDGDSIGSLMGMKGYLETIGKKVTPIVPSPYPEFLGFLDMEKEVLTYSEMPHAIEEKVKGAQLIICLDFNSLKRIDALGQVIAEAAAPKALIDHHPQPDTLFNYVYSYPHMSSACELTYWIIKDLVEILGSNMPMCSCIALYTGMMTDTNNFNNSVLPSTFRMAGELMEAGVDKEWVQKMVFGGYSAERMRLMGYMLHENMKLIPQYNAAVMVLTKAIKEKYNFSDGDSEGFVNLALNIKSVRVSALFTEDNGFLRVSLRSKDDFSVNRLSRAYFNGGGHERAAGGRLYIPVGEVEDYFIKSLEEFIENEKQAQHL